MIVLCEGLKHFFHIYPISTSLFSLLKISSILYGTKGIITLYPRTTKTPAILSPFVRSEAYFLIFHSPTNFTNTRVTTIANAPLLQFAAYLLPLILLTITFHDSDALGLFSYLAQPCSGGSVWAKLCLEDKCNNDNECETHSCAYEFAIMSST